MKKVVLLLLVAMVGVTSVYAQKSKDEYYGDLINTMFLRSPKPQVIREIEKYLSTQKKVSISDITVKISEDKRMIGWHIIEFVLKPTQRTYNFDCFPLPKYGKSGDEDWVKVTLDTSKFAVQSKCEITLSDFIDNGYTYCCVKVHFNVYTTSIETHSEDKKVMCKFTDLTTDLKAYLASKFKTK